MFSAVDMMDIMREKFGGRYKMWFSKKKVISPVCACCVCSIDFM